MAVTAEVECCTLVTNERRLINHAGDHGVAVLTTRQLLAELGFHPG